MTRFMSLSQLEGVKEEEEEKRVSLGEAPSSRFSSLSQLEKPEERGPSEAEMYEKYYLKGEEREWAFKSPLSWSISKAVADIVPYGSAFLFAGPLPSGARRFQMLSKKEKVKHLAWESAVIIPLALVGTGVKLMGKAFAVGAKGGIKAGKKVARMKLPVIETHPFADLLRFGKEPFERRTLIQNLAKEYDITIKEAGQVARGENWLLEKVREGTWGAVRGSKKFQELFDKKGLLTDKVKGKVRQYSKPLDEQELAYNMKQWKDTTKEVLQRDYSFDEIFKSQAARLGIKGTKLGEVDALTLQNMTRDLLVSVPKALRKSIDRGFGSIIPKVFLPTRIIWGMGEKVYKTFKNFYEPMKRMFENRNRYNFAQTANFQAIAQSMGLGRLVARPDGSFKFLWGKMLTEKEIARKMLGESVPKIDNFLRKDMIEGRDLIWKTSQMRREGVAAKRSSKEVTAEIQEVCNKASINAQLLRKAYKAHTDLLYGDYAKKKIWQIFEEAELTEIGKDGLTLLMKGPRGIERIIDQAFSVGANVAGDRKQQLMNAILGRLKKSHKGEWFEGALKVASKTEKDLLRRRLTKIEMSLTPMSKKKGSIGFINYTDDYAAAIGSKARLMAQSRTRRLAGERVASFRRERTAVKAPEEAVDFSSMVDARIRAQATELYVNPQLPKIIRFSKRLPASYREFAEHHISRMLGEASVTDIRLANWLTQHAPAWMGKWSPRRLQNFAWAMNDLVFMGGLGFKPFSAMRNYFQPLINVPADMGGIKDLFWLLGGYKKAFSVEGRRYVRSIGAIREYAPDLFLRAGVGKPRALFLGIHVPAKQTVRDTSLWMFKMSDRHNRYVSGGAAMAKWDYYLKKFGEKELTPSGELILTGKMTLVNKNRFLKKINTSARRPWMKSKIDELVHSGNLEGMNEAKKMWVNDVIEDTQYLYTALDAPLISHTGGSLGRTGFIFQSWWANYAANLEKWFIQPSSVSSKLQRYFAWILSAAIAEQIASTIWDKGTVARIHGLGPLPTGPWSAPPTWAPVVHTMQLIVETFSTPWEDKPEAIKRGAKRILTRDVPILIPPAGLQARQTLEYLGRDPNLAGLFKGAIKYKWREEK